MSLLVEKEEELADIVRAARVVAVVGAKDGSRADAPAYTIPKWLQSLGIRILPVNPKFTTILGERVYSSVADLPERPDILDVFRRVEFIEALADEVLALPPDRRPPVFWMQTGIRNEAAAKKLTAAGIRVVMDHCLGVLADRYRT
ncbi:MAG: CoA-binding protein [Candidatus Eiseniibacteriota bacterium]